ncbi:hypothetical protein ABPG75_011697 [Micractinium tetrahymenae]
MHKALRGPKGQPGRLRFFWLLLLFIGGLVLGLSVRSWGSVVNRALLGGPQPRRHARARRLARRHCQGTLGTWCTGFRLQVPVPAMPPPRGNLTCSLDCNQVGTCSALTGLCTCPAGWTGFNCLLPMKRHCASTWRRHGFEPQPGQGAAGVVAAARNGSSFWLLPGSHCAGDCDDTIAACYCPANTTYGRIPAAAEAPPGSPPLRAGRPMGQWCQPSRTPDGRPSQWGTVEPELLWGPEGWCNAATPQQQCPCYDGWSGTRCELPTEQFCLNQCNGRGECLGGYCKCDPGWHGIDCAHRSLAADNSKPGRQVQRPWIAQHVHTPAKRQFRRGETRLRPLIYVYELPSEFSTLMLQYRQGGADCVPRTFVWPNDTKLSGWTYASETGFLEALLHSPHRTLSPEEADFFYVPVLPSCLIHPVRRMADSVRDTFYGMGPVRVHAATNLLLEAFHWIQSHHPYWQRRGGRDHIWLVSHDEASCYVPAAIRPSIILSHWGRLDAGHASGSGYHEDDYSREWRHPQWEPGGVLRKLGTFPCYDPAKDLVLPSMKPPEAFADSPLAGAPARPRTWLAFHRGRAQLDNPRYSRGLRQRLYTAAREQGWRERHAILIGEASEVPGRYSQLLASSTFCLVLPGDGWTARIEDATLHGCIPVIIMDQVHVSFESILDLSAFTLRIPEAEAERLPEVLRAVPEARRRQMQLNLARVWQRFAYTSYRPYAAQLREIQARHEAARNASGNGGSGGSGGSSDAGGSASNNEMLGSMTAEPPSLPATVAALDPAVGDAFGTVMAWLHSRIPATRQPPP